jgi:hypothetical protein
MGFSDEDRIIFMKEAINCGEETEAMYQAGCLTTKYTIDRLRLLEKWWEEAERNNRILLGTIDKIIERTKQIKEK